MKKTILALSFATLSAALSAATVESVIVRQMWPWSTDIKVEYQLSGVDASHPVDISVRAFNGGTEIGGVKEGGMEISRTVSVICRPVVSKNGGWL